MTLLPSFHISVMSVSPGYTTPENLAQRQDPDCALSGSGIPNFDIAELAESLQDVLARNAKKAQA